MTSNLEKVTKITKKETMTDTTIDLTSDSEHEMYRTPPRVKRPRRIAPTQVLETSDEESEPGTPPPEFTLNKSNKPSKSWFYTLNNYTDEDVKTHELLDCTFHVFGKEIGKEGTPHLQGCITFKKSMRMTALKLISPKAHWEIPKHLEAARNYCLKDQDCFVRDHRKQGERSDLLLACDILKRGGNLEEVAETFPTVYVKYVKGLSCFKALQILPRDGKPNITWIYGPTGSGKSAYVYYIAKGRAIFSSDGNYDFFNGYDNQPIALFDDFRDNRSMSTFLRLFDRYPITVNVKYGCKQWNPTDIFVTAPYAPRDAFSNDSEEDKEQLLRRIDNIVEFKQPKASSGGWSVVNINYTRHKGTFETPMLE